MTHTASISVSEREAFRLVEGLDAEPALVGLAVNAVENPDGGWSVTLYLAAPPDAALAAGLAGLARSVLGAGAPAFSFARLPDTDWVAKSLEGLRPVRAGRFLVHGR